MEITFFSTKSYDRRAFEQAPGAGAHRFRFLEAGLEARTAVAAQGAAAVCIFVNDRADADALAVLAEQGVKLLALRCAGFNNVDLEAAARLGIAVARVPEYSPYAVAEHAVGLILALNRKLHRAYNRVREHNFELEGLLGFDLHGRTVGAIGTGRIGTRFLQIMRGFGCELLAFDPYPNEEVRALGVRYVELDDLLTASDVVSLHCPLTPQTHHLIDRRAVERMREGAMLINTSRGAVVDATALIAGLKRGRIGSLGLDVYEEEGDLFFENLSDVVIQDDVFARLLTFPNVLITGHQAFFTAEALAAIAETTLRNVDDFAEQGSPTHPVTRELVA